MQTRRYASNNRNSNPQKKANIDRKRSPAINLARFNSPKILTVSSRLVQPNVNKRHLMQFSSSAARIAESPLNLSTCSTSSMHELETFIADVMGVRMQSIQDLQKRVEELFSLQKQEESAFQIQLSTMLEQSELIHNAQLLSEEEHEKMLRKERLEKERTLNLLRTFKREGELVIYQLQESLKLAQEKWRQEVERNAKLNAELRLYQASSNKSTQKDALEQRIGTLKQLLEEDDSIIIELQNRNKHLEQRLISANKELENVRQGLSMMTDEGEQIDKEYKELLSQLSLLKNPLNEISDSELIKQLNEKVSLLNKFSSVIVKKLKSEQRQRLLSEEQASKVVDAQETMVKNLEQKIKDLELRCRRSFSESIDKKPNNIIKSPEVEKLLSAKIALFRQPRSEGDSSVKNEKKPEKENVNQDNIPIENSTKDIPEQQLEMDNIENELDFSPEEN